MKRDGNVKGLAFLLLICFLCMGSVFTLQAYGVGEAPVLSEADCIKCHAEQPADIARAGASHKEVNCTYCHTGHRPSSPNNIPQCSICHEGESHFELEGCLNCHTNPHTPLNITLAGDLTTPCLTCHDAQIEQLKAHPSKHTELFCSNCHDVHGRKPECLQCHSPHAEHLTSADCKKCHKAHMPAEVTYGDDVLNKDCGACHNTAYSQLSNSKAKHGTFDCAFCHEGKHKAMPQCQDCHGVPHPEGIMAKFPSCGSCHNVAHDLNNWQ